jgi:hypothetical protein
MSKKNGHFRGVPELSGQQKVISCLLYVHGHVQQQSSFRRELVKLLEYSIEITEPSFVVCRQFWQ